MTSFVDRWSVARRFWESALEMLDQRNDEFRGEVVGCWEIFEDLEHDFGWYSVDVGQHDARVSDVEC